MRYTDHNRLAYCWPETGMVVVPEAEIVERGRLGPAGVIEFDLEKAACCMMLKSSRI